MSLLEKREKHVLKGMKDQVLIFLHLIRHWNQGQELDFIFLNMSAMQPPLFQGFEVWVFTEGA